jgi:hypothetical protein
MPGRSGITHEAGDGRRRQPPLRHRLDHARHFLQTAASSGVPASLVQGILDEIENDTDRAINVALDGLPSGFPERIVSSVIEGVRRRLRLFAHATA